MIAKYMTALLGLSLLTGCASLRVDVDVYKGPLINEPDVQLQQVAAQAIAAGPLIKTMITDTKSGGYDVKAFKPYVDELRFSLEMLADMIETDPKAVSIVSQLAKDSATDTAAAHFAARIFQANEEIARHASAPQARAKLDLLRAQLLTEPSPDIAQAKTQIKQIATETQSGGIVQRLANLKNKPVDLTTKPELRKSLIEFAERTRWLGNHAKLFLKLLDDEMAAQAAPFSPTPIDEPRRKLRQAVETHALILQAIGNAILSQTNEIERMAGLNDDKRNQRLMDRERAVWSGTHWARDQVLAAIKTRDQKGWGSFPLSVSQDFKTGLLAHLNAADDKVLEAIGLLGGAIPLYQQAVKPLTIVNKALEKTGQAKCNEKDNGTPNELLKACLGNDFTELPTLEKALIGEGKKIADSKLTIALSALHGHLNVLKKELDDWTADLALLRTWKASLEGMDAFLTPELKAVDAKNPREVVDLGVARLRAQQAQAALAGDTARRDRVEDAIQVLLAHRAGMVPLVPSSSFLRNSMPATSLSEGINEKDEANMLWQAFIRAFPDTRANGEEKMRQDMDKQYWQPVNRVRVSGGGGVNQVLVKDDVGNWYVKSFDSDKKVVFESMKKLALYHLAGETASLGTLRTQLATTKGLLPDQLKMSDLGIGQAAPATAGANDIGAPLPTVGAETTASTPNGTAADVYKVAVTRYAKALHAAYQTLQCDADAGTVNTDECAGGKLAPKALEDLGKKDLRKLGEDVAGLLDKRVKECKPNETKTDCTPTAQATSVLLKDMSKSLSEATKRLKTDMETISESIGRPLQ
ncbi:MAG: hypothetical protein HZB71_08095 [Betaproteobacteria bacterium]|nr:hypothetical protein [Betaproteobacteria bacterium]